MKIKDIEGWLVTEQKKLEAVGYKIDLTVLKLEELKADETRLKKTISMLTAVINKIKTNQNL